MPDPIRQKLITDQWYARLDTLTGVTVYRSEVPSSPPTITGSDGRVKPYVVLWPFGGVPAREQDLGDQSTDIDYGGQLDCVAGYIEDCEALIDRVHPLVYRWSPTIAGLSFGGFRPPVGFQPGAVQKNEAVNPPRYWVPLQYRLAAAR